MCFCTVNPVLQDAVSKLTITSAKCEFYGLQQCKNGKSKCRSHPEPLLLCEDSINIKSSLVVQILKKLLVADRNKQANDKNKLCIF